MGTNTRKGRPGGARDSESGRFVKGFSGNPRGRKPRLRSPSLVAPPGDAPHTRAALDRLWELALQSTNMNAAVSATRQLREHYSALESLVEKPIMTITVPTDDLMEVVGFIEAQAEEFGFSQESALGLVGALLKGEHGTRLEYEVYDGGCVKTINGPTVEARDG